MLPVDQITVRQGETADLVVATVPVANVLPEAAKVTDTWTSHSVNAGDAHATIKYRITGSRPGRATRQHPPR